MMDRKKQTIPETSPHVSLQNESVPGPNICPTASSVESNSVIRVEGLWKQYRLGTINHGTLARDLQSWWARIRGKEDPNSPLKFTPQGDGPLSHETLADRFWALSDISFDVKQGEVLGIIGRNGAGKSTLLKILSKVTTPTKGQVLLKGRVASLLEVGTGFHPELTGRENIFLNGAILGMTKQEIRQKFDEIVAFAEVDTFIDTPVKRYSSGMYVRLAFAVAAHLESEILIVDEVLAVGDLSFQKKCIGKMQEVGREGRTVLFVSHNMGAIHTLTQQCVYLENGLIRSHGETSAIVSDYLSDSSGASGGGGYDLDFYRPDYVIKANKGDLKINYTDIWVEQDGKRCSVLYMGSPFVVFFELVAHAELSGANISFSILNEEFQCVTVVFSWDSNFYLNLKPGKHTIRLDIRGHILTPGKYYIGTGVNQSTESVAWDAISNLPLFEVVNSGKVVHWLHRTWGSVHWDDIRWHQGNA